MPRWMTPGSTSPPRHNRTELDDELENALDELGLRGGNAVGKAPFSVSNMVDASPTELGEIGRKSCDKSLARYAFTSELVHTCGVQVIVSQ